MQEYHALANGRVFATRRTKRKNALCNLSLYLGFPLLPLSSRPPAFRLISFLAPLCVNLRRFPDVTWLLSCSLRCESAGTR